MTVDKLHLITAVLHQLQYELLLHKTRRKELGLDGELFRQHRSHIEEMNNCLARLTAGPDAAKVSGQLPGYRPLSRYSCSVLKFD